MIWILLILFQLKHFFCDYPLQTPYMLGKFKGGKEWILPLTVHAAVHALATLLIGLAFNAKVAAWCAAIDFVLHFTMDRIKASPTLLGRYRALSSTEYKFFAHQKEVFSGLAVKEDLSEKDRAGYAQLVGSIGDHFSSNTKFWWALGIDQGVHHLTHYLIIAILLGA